MLLKKKLLDFARHFQKIVTEEPGQKENEKDMPSVSSMKPVLEMGRQVKNKEILGDVHVSTSAIATAVSWEVKQVDGVLGMSSLLADHVVKALGKNNLSDGQGVRVNFEDHFVVIDIYIVVEYGCNIPEVAMLVQERVKREIESHFKLKVQTVDVHVENVAVKKKFVQQESEEMKA